MIFLHTLLRKRGFRLIFACLHACLNPYSLYLFSGSYTSDQVTLNKKNRYSESFRLLCFAFKYCLHFQQPLDISTSNQFSRFSAHLIKRSQRHRLNSSSMLLTILHNHQIGVSLDKYCQNHRHNLQRRPSVSNGHPHENRIYDSHR